MDALEVLAIEAEPYRLELVEAKWTRDRMRARGASGNTMASADALVAAAEAAYEPYRLHVEGGFAARAVGVKQQMLDDLKALPLPMTGEALTDREARIRFAEQQLEGAQHAAEEWAALIAAHPEASKRAIVTGEVSALAPVVR